MYIRMCERQGGGREAGREWCGGGGRGGAVSRDRSPCMPWRGGGGVWFFSCFVFVRVHRHVQETGRVKKKDSPAPATAVCCNVVMLLVPSFIHVLTSTE